MKPLIPDDVYQHRTLQDLSASPRHTRVVFVRSRASRKSDSYTSTAWQIDTAPDAGRARQLTSASSSARSLLLDPAGERMAFLAQRDAKKGQQVHLIALDGGEARAVTDEPDEIKALLAWSHDGRRLLATQDVKWAEDEHDDIEAKSRPLVVKHLPYKIDGTGPKVGRRTRLVAIDVGTGKVSVLMEGDFDVSEAQWSPDGSRLAISRKRGGQQRHQADLWLADGDGGGARQVTDDLYSVGGLAFSPDGRRLAFGAGRIEAIRSSTCMSTTSRPTAAATSARTHCNWKARRSCGIRTAGAWRRSARAADCSSRPSWTWMTAPRADSATACGR